MNNDKTIVVTAFGHDKTIEKISVGLFDGSGYSGSSIASNYCRSINSLELKEDAWVHAKIFDENLQYSLTDIFRPSKFPEMILQYDDRSIQKVLYEVETHELAKALKSVDAEVQDKIFRNMSKRAAVIVKEDMEYMGPVRLRDVEEAQHKIDCIFSTLEVSGEILTEGDE